MRFAEDEPMEVLRSSDFRTTESPLSTSQSGVLGWYAVYTSANREKRVAEQLSVRAIEHFLPVYLSLRRWKDRRVELERPLFPGYLFVRLALRDKLSVVQTPGVAQLVGFNGRPTALADAEISSLQASLRSGVRIEPHPYLTAGKRVRIRDGPLSGMQGILLRRKGKFRVVLSVHLIQRSVVVEMAVESVEVLK